MSRIVFSEEGWADYIFWQSCDKKIVDRINQLIKSIEREGPMKGIGKPERLKYNYEYYSRRIDDKNRLLYKVLDNQIMIDSCLGHYRKKRKT